MENISKELSRFDIVDSDGTSIVFSLLYAILIIVGLLLLCHFIDKYLLRNITPKPKKQSKQIEQLEHLVVLPESESTQIDQEENHENNHEENIKDEQTQIIESQELLQESQQNLTIEQSTQPIQELSQELQQINQPQPNLTIQQPTQELPQELPQESPQKIQQEESKRLEDLACEWKMDKVKQFYKKGEDVFLPSSIGGKSGYIGRDHICYRHLVKDQNYISKRGGCMACTVDESNGGKNITFAETNILTTCIYGSDEDALIDNKIWSKKKCQTVCSEMSNKM